MADHLHYFEDPDREDAALDYLRRREQQYSAARATATPEAAQRAAQISRANPWISPGVVASLAKAQAPDELVQRVSAAEAARQEEKGGFTKLGAVLTGAVRAAFTAIDTIRSELILRPRRAVAGAADRASRGGGFRVGQFFSELDDTYRLAGDSAGVLAVKKLLRGERVDLGTGFSPGGELAAEAERQARRLRLPDGSIITLGNLIGAGLNEVTYYTTGRELVAPGSTARNVISGFIDAGEAIFGDPANVAGGAVTKVRRAAKTFEGTADLGLGLKVGRYADGDKVKFGLLGGSRQAVDPEAFIQHYLRGTDEGRELVSRMAQETEFAKIWQGIKGMDRKTALRLTAADTDEKVIDVLDDVLGTSIRELPKYRPPRLDDVRILRDVPGAHVSVDDVEDGMRTLDDFMVNAKVGKEKRYLRLREMAELDDGDTVGVQRVVLRALADVDGALRERGVDSHLAKTMTRLFDEYAEEMRKYNIDEHGNNVAFPGAKKRVFEDGTEKVLASAHTLSEYMQKAVPLPDFRGIRHAASRMAQIEKLVPAGEGFSETVRLLNEVYVQDVWKPFTLMRGAWTVRVIGEEMIRLTAAGLDSPFLHPLSYIAYLRGRKGTTDIVGNALDDAAEFQAAMSRGAAGLYRGSARVPARMLTGDFVDVGKDHPEYIAYWTAELRQLWRDPVARVTAAGRHSLADVKDWFWEGNGATYRRQLVEGGGREKRLLIDDVAAREDGYESARAAADAYIDSVMKRIRVKTGDSDELMDSLATRELDGINLDVNDAEFRRKVRKALSKRLDVAPERVKAPRDAEFQLFPDRRNRLAQRYDLAVRSVFDVLMSRPTNKLSRSPAFKQAYWREVERLLHYTDDATKAKIIAQAKAAGFKGDDLARMEAIKGSGRISDSAVVGALPKGEQGFKTALDVIDEYAKAHALGFTRKLLYDLSKRNQLFDVTRNILPFGEAWKEIMTTWGRLAYESPHILNVARRVHDGFKYAGIFYSDPVTNEETFVMPGGSMLAKTMGLGDTAGFRMTGRAAGLNVATGSVIPSMGPTAQWAADKFLPNAPQWTWIRSLVFPYGPPDADTAGEFIDASLPAYLKKVVQGWSNGHIDEPAWNNTVAALARHAIIEGKFDPSQWREALDWAAPRARWLYLVNGVAQAFAPTGPRIEFVAEDAEERTFQLQAAAREFAALAQESGDYMEAVDKFVGKFGHEPWMLTQSRSVMLRHRATTSPGVRWEAENPDLVKLLPHTVGLFAPDDPNAEYDLAAYKEQIARGDRARLTPEQQMRMANHRAASMVYRRAVERLGDRDDDAARLWKRRLYYALREEYPGFDEVSDVPKAVQLRLGRPHPWLPELEAAAENPKVAKTEAGQGLALLLAARRKAMDASAALGLTAEIPFANANRAAHIRDWYRNVADQIVREYPEAAGVWDLVLSREMRAEEREGLDEQEAAA